MPDEIDPNYDVEESAEGKTSLDNPFSCTKLAENGLKMALRRPSGEGDDLLDMVEGTLHSDTNTYDASEESSAPLDNPFPCTKLAENGLKMALRRPSGEGDDLLAMVEGTLHSDTNTDDASAESSAHSSFQRWRMEAGKDLISPQVSLRKQAEPDQTNTFLQLIPNDKGALHSCANVSAVSDFTSPLEITGRIDENRSTELDLAMTSEQSEAIDRYEMEKIPGLTDWKDGALGAPEAPSPPSEHLSKHKPRKSRLSLFRRVKSWKGVVPLSDDED
jgi:hypothetical protein